MPTEITAVLRQVSPPRNRSQIAHSSTDGISKPMTGMSAARPTKVSRPTSGQQARAGEGLAVGEVSTDDQQCHRQATSTRLTRKGHRPGPGSRRVPEPVPVREDRAAQAEGEGDEGTDDLVGRSPCRRPLLGELLGDLGLELGQDVGSPVPVAAAPSSLAHVSSSCRIRTGSSGLSDRHSARLMSYFFDQVGVALLVGLELGDDGGSVDLHRRQAVLRR